MKLQYHYLRLTILFLVAWILASVMLYMGVTTWKIYVVAIALGFVWPWPWITVKKGNEE